VGGSGVEVGMRGVGVAGVPKSERQAESPIVRIRINCAKKERGLEKHRQDYTNEKPLSHLERGGARVI